MVTDETYRMFHNEWVDLEDKIPASDFETSHDSWSPMVRVMLDEGAYLPERAHKTDAGADIRTPKGFVIPPFGWKVIHTGVHIETPSGHATILVSKSGLNVKRGITSSGLIDEGYDGEVIVKLYNHTPFLRRFRRGDKITQMVIMEVMYARFSQVDRIGSGDRGSSGFGSTGR